MRRTKNQIIAVLVYIERRKTRKLVGTLTYDDKRGDYVFVYDKRYLSSKLIPLGPELPLSRKPFISQELFESFVDRIPSRENPAYKEYCLQEDISPEEENSLVLLTTIARRGPSSFVFEPLYLKKLHPKDVKKYREELQLTIREFAMVFDISEKTLVSIEKEGKLGGEVMKRLEIYIDFPELAFYQFRRSSAGIHIEKKRLLEKILSQKIKEKKKGA